MSHQDPDGRTAFPHNFQALKDAFLWLLQAADLSPIQFRGDCTWSSLGLIFTALLWSWSDEKTLQDRFSTARKICFKALGKLALGQGAAKEPAGSYQAFMKMLRIWTASVVLQLMVVFRERMLRHAPRSAHHRRLRSLRCRWQSARSAADEVQRVTVLSPVGSEAAAWQGRETAQARRASRPGGTFPCQEGQQPPDLADGHVARGDRPALGLANRALRQQ